MSSQQLHNGLKQTPALSVDYQLFEISDLNRATDDAGAVKTVLGPPLPTATGSQREIGRMPLVIVGYDQRPIIKMLQKQRVSTPTALRPIAVVGIAEDVESPVLRQLADIVLPPGAQRDVLQAMRDRLFKISGVVHKLSPAHDDRALLFLQYLHSRDGGGEIMPVVDASARFAYRYPLAEHLLSTSSVETLDVLQDLAEHELLTGKVVDRLFLCPTCKGYRVPVKELCPECQAPNVGTQDSIHHFRCGYVGPESEFISSGKPVCPKCNAELRHIGVEYNRPGRIVTCEDCGHWASEPHLRAWCVDCNTYHTPEQLSIVRISRFGITRKGMRVAQAGRWNPYHAQLIFPEASADGRSDNASSYEHTRQIARDLIDLASTNEWAMTVYQAEVVTPVDDSLSPEQRRDQLKATEQHIKTQLGTRSLLTQLNRGNFLAFTVNGEDRTSPSPSVLESQINGRTGLRVQITALTPSAAAYLLGQ